MTPRERRERAEDLEREAETTDDHDLWAVVSDAWEEDGNRARAWYAFLRSRGQPNRIITSERAEILGRTLAAMPERPTRDDDDRANRLRSELEVYDFLTKQPERYFAYHLDDGNIVTFMSDRLGTISRKGRIVRPFGSGGRIQHVVVRAINGFDYRGTCAVENGTYCRLRRAKPWLQR